MGGEELMAIKLPVKKNAVSNKTQTPTSNSENDPVKTGPFPAPFIDKISIVVDIPLSAQAEIHSAFWQSADDHSWLVNSPKGKGYGFNYAKRIVIDHIAAQEKWPQIQYRMEGKLAVKLRLEFVPVDLGAIGLADLSSKLICLMDDGWAFITTHGKITRLDVSVDIPNMMMNDFVCLPKQGATSQAWSVNGHRQTYVIGTPKGHQTLIYSRDAKRKAKKQSWSKPPEVRVERRLRTQNLNFSNLADLPNPFDAFKIARPLQGPPTGEPNYVWNFFKDSVEVRGLVAALALLPEKKRTLYRKHIGQWPHPKWDKDVIWSQWPEMLADLNLIPS
jgi:hypothetical protein